MQHHQRVVGRERNSSQELGERTPTLEVKRKKVNEKGRLELVVSDDTS